VKEEATADFEGFQFHHLTKLIQDFFWHEFCDFYLEYTKHRIYQPEIYGAESKRAAQYTMRTVLLECCQLLAPITAHMSEEIWQSFNPGRSVHLTSWPAAHKKLIDETAEKQALFLNEITAKARQYKAERKLPLNADIASANIACDFPLDEIKEEISATARIKVINFTNGERSINLM
jgi:valyl-tRNA synthetase